MSKRRGALQMEGRMGSRRDRRNAEMVAAMGASQPQELVARIPRRAPQLYAKTEAQGHYMLSIDSRQLTFGLGCAGTGKTYVCTMMAAKLLDDGKIEKLIVTRPAVEAGQGLGFLPGTVEEKFAPYFAPFRQVLEAYFGETHLEYLIKRGKIEIAPLEFIRGLTFDNAFVILDEAQNTTPGQMKLFLTRLGENTKVVVNGDESQVDIRCESGLIDAVNKLDGLSRVGVCEFTEEDVVRSGLVKDILMRYRNK